MELVRISGLDPSEFHSYPVHFYFSEEDWKDEPEEEQKVAKTNKKNGNGNDMKEAEANEYIWTYEFGSENNPNLVIVHGYGGSGMVFFKMFEKLSEYFHVYLIDMLGMGRSSRNDFKCNTYDECEKFFTRSIEKWRQAIGLEKINILGHSFGGFICSKYALKHPEAVNKLILFSPWASECSSEEHKIEFDKKIEESPWSRRTTYGFVKKMYNNKSSPFSLARKSGRWLGPYLIKRFVKRRISNLPEDELEAFANYMVQIIMRKGSGEFGFGIMFPNFMYSDKAIAYHLDEYKELGIEISFYYGSVDWMDSSFNGKRVSKQLKEKGQKVYNIKH